MSDDRNYDVVIVGAGIAGSIMAKELTRAGKNVLLLEAGVSTDMGWEGYLESLNTFYGGWGDAWIYAGFSGAGSSRTAGNPIARGTLLVDLFISQTRRLIWRATAAGVVTDDPKNAATRIQKAAEKMFKMNFPPTAGRR